MKKRSSRLCYLFSYTEEIQAYVARVCSRGIWRELASRTGAHQCPWQDNEAMSTHRKGGKEKLAQAAPVGLSVRSAFAFLERIIDIIKGEKRREERNRAQA